MKMYRCRSCDEEKPYSEYYKKSYGNGIQSYCKKCAIARSTAYATAKRKAAGPIKYLTYTVTGVKHCSMCNLDKPIEAFSLRNTYESVTVRHSYCIECVAKRNVERNRAKGVLPKAQHNATRKELSVKKKLAKAAATLKRRDERKIATQKRREEAKKLRIAVGIAKAKEYNILQKEQAAARMLVSEKRCTFCDTTLPISSFGYKKRHRKDGSLLISYNSICKKCKTAENKKYINLSARAAVGAKRRATKINATPKWLTKQQLHEMKLIYATRLNVTRKTGITHHVDHIVPLNHPEVCGLHVPWNLRVITEEENVAKSNSLSGIPAEQRWYPLDQ